METKKKLSTGYLMSLIIIWILNIAWLTSRIVLFSDIYLATTLIPIGMLVVTAFYTLYGYKKPHGNTIRHLLLVYVVYEGIILLNSAAWQPMYMKAVNLAIVVLSTYMAGRLNKIEQNIIISVIIAILHIVYIYPFINMAISRDTLVFVNLIGSIGPVTIWLAIAGAYITRYKLHKEAGLED